MFVDTEEDDLEVWDHMTAYYVLFRRPRGTGGKLQLLPFIRSPGVCFEAFNNRIQSPQAQNGLLRGNGSLSGGKIGAIC